MKNNRTGNRKNRTRQWAAALVTGALMLQATTVNAFASNVICAGGAEKSAQNTAAAPGQTAPVPDGVLRTASGKLAERLTVRAGQFVRANGTAIEGAVAKGVTVSKYQNRAGAIAWEQAAADGVSFAMVRLGYLNDLDPYFAENMNGAAANGIRTGVFFYTQAADVETARQEAQFVLEQVKGYSVTFPIAYDVESQYLLDMGKTPQEITEQINAFCEVIAAAGYRPIVYGNNLWLTGHMDTAQIPYDIWYARYETSVNAYPNRTIWQYTDAGTVAGIPGEVCIELAFTDYPELRAEQEAAN